MTRPSARPAAGDDDAIETVARLATLMAGGAAPAAAWSHLAAGGGAVVNAAADAARRGVDVGPVLVAAGGSWIGVGAIWSVAVETGAPLAETLRGAVVALRDVSEVSADVAVALAEPTSTARLLGWLPVLGVPMGYAMGFDPVSILVTDPLGPPCLVIGGLLMVGARLWTRALARRARPAARIPGLEPELWAVALSAGVSVDRASALMGGLADVGEDDQATAAVQRTLDLATRAGVPAVELLRGDAWLARHRARTEGRTAAARLSTRLLLPLAVCTLPAFLLLAVVPLVLGIVRSNAFP
ncbi:MULTISPECIES: type II secretion system F family protein [Microbacterium]|uniref:type II secretion system F family protein n=1 Tax=Microbacterium TaxID=33882 RepID=UPI001E5B33F0|nr:MULTISPECIES: pilus assembly protein TadB [Microbacterium]MCD2170822.1 pilus assembly protein TadB [Microbacterium sp. JC 701]